jgi:hypothetical protein
LRQQVVRWVADNEKDLAGHDPKIPESITNDRLIDNWTPLLAIADKARGEWPERARQIMISQHFESDADEDSFDLILLQDLKDIFDKQQKDRLFTKEILAELHELEERPWPEYPNRRGPAKPITDRQVARLLEPHEIKPKLFKRHGITGRGYEWETFEETWARYLESGVQTVTPLQPAENLGESGNSPDVASVAVTDASVTRYQPVTPKPAENLEGNGVTDETPLAGNSDVDQADLDERAAIENEPNSDDDDPLFIPPWLERRRPSNTEQ